MKLMIFNAYLKTQQEKLRIFADYARGVVLDIGGTQAPNQYLERSKLVDEIFLLDKNKPSESNMCHHSFQFDLDEIMKKPLFFKDEFFDTVILGDVLEHLLFPFAVLTEIKRILKPGGTLLISSPSPKYYLEIIHMFLFGKPMGFPEHKMLLTREQLRHVLKTLGFSVEKEMGYSFWLPIIKLGFVNTTKTNLPELLTWQQINVCKKVS